MPSPRNPLLDEEPTGFKVPHVVYLLYELMPEESHVAIRQREPVEFETPDFKVRVACDGGEIPGMGGVVRASSRVGDSTAEHPTEAAVLLKKHYATMKAARLAVEPTLDSWALDATLNHGYPRFYFLFVGSTVRDLKPPHGYTVIAGGGFIVVKPREETVASLPPPPTTFAADEHAATLWTRWNRYLDKQAELPAVAYAVLTYLETEIASGRAAAAEKLGISGAVLATLGRLASNVGDAQTTRKFRRGGPKRPYAQAETEWLEAIVPEIIRRVGELAAGSEPAALTMADLPKLMPQDSREAK